MTSDQKLDRSHNHPDKFNEAARQLETDVDPDRFNDALGKLGKPVKHKPAEKQAD